MPAKKQDTTTRTSRNGLWVKRDSSTGTFVGTKSFKGVRKEALEKLSPTLNKLTKYDKQ